MIQLVKVVEAKVLDGQRPWVRFTDGTEGVCDSSDIIAEGGPMVDAFRDNALFKRVFVPPRRPPKSPLYAKPTLALAAIPGRFNLTLRCGFSRRQCAQLHRA
jgi:hypothetical protein